MIVDTFSDLRTGISDPRPLYNVNGKSKPNSCNLYLVILAVDVCLSSSPFSQYVISISGVVADTVWADHKIPILIFEFACVSSCSEFFDFTPLGPPHNPKDPETIAIQHTPSGRRNLSLRGKLSSFQALPLIVLGSEISTGV